MWQIVGQSRIQTLLQRGLERNTLAHAYLFVGPPHIGKMTLALDLARALNCTGNEPPCGQCESCRKIGEGKHADVPIIELTSYEDTPDKLKTLIGVEQIEDTIIRFANLPPFEGKYKVFIINSAELLSEEAANCLLKTLEEPGPGVFFILLSSNDKFLLPTVISRCQRMELTRLPPGKIEAALTARWNVESQKARLLARLARGCLGWAVEAATKDTLLQERAERIEHMFAVMSGGLEEGFAFAAQLAEQFGKNRVLAQDILDVWLDCWHDMLLIKAGQTAMVTNTDHLARFVDVSKGYSLAQVRDFVKRLRAAKEHLKRNANARLALEVLMLNLPRREGLPNSAAVLKT